MNNEMEETVLFSFLITWTVVVEKAYATLSPQRTPEEEKGIHLQVGPYSRISQSHFF
jgi:hypothetical protein